MHVDAGVYVYIIETRIGWQVRTSHAIAIDFLYWYGNAVDSILWSRLAHRREEVGKGWLFVHPLSYRQAQLVVDRWCSQRVKNKASDRIVANEVRKLFFQLIKQVCGEERQEDSSLVGSKSRSSNGTEGLFQQWKSLQQKYKLMVAKEAGTKELADVLGWDVGRACIDMRQYAALQYGADKGGKEEREVTYLVEKVLQVQPLLEGRSLLVGEVWDVFGVGADVEVQTERKKIVQHMAEGLAVIQFASLVGYGERSPAIVIGSLRQNNSLLVGLVSKSMQQFRCLRCGSSDHIHYSNCAACGEDRCAYCTQCLTMGRSRACTLLVQGIARSAMRPYEARSEQLARVERMERLKKWGLSAAQSAASLAALQYIEDSKDKRGRLENRESRIRENRNRKSHTTRYENHCLFWAVTGAGKTEMVFPLVESVLLRSGKVLIATPRRDVVLELDPRLRRAFPSHRVTTLYGGSTQRWEQGEITIATTHQLIRFCARFDLVIIDELDAFPYVNDPMLHYAAAKAGREDAVRILLSATPPRELQRAASRGRLAHVKVPVRYHRYPLPVPQLITTKSVTMMLASRKLHPKLLSALQQSLQRGAQLFVFLQRIEQTEPFAAMLRQLLRHHSNTHTNTHPHLHSQIAATSSKDKERREKVEQFRQGVIRLLVTTTILERGVTIPRSDVYILDADGALFDEASLVQMAGRAGRSADDPFGKVYFCAAHYNEAQRKAIKQIRAMNRLAKRKGYLLPPPARKRTEGGRR